MLTKKLEREFKLKMLFKAIA